MASTAKRRKGLYEGSDFPGGLLIYQAVKHIKYGKLSSLAEHLKIPKSEYECVVQGSLTKEEQINNVSTV